MSCEMSFSYSEMFMFVMFVALNNRHNNRDNAQLIHN